MLLKGSGRWGLGWRALVIEPDEVQRSVVCDALRSEGWEVDEAAAGEEALRESVRRQWALAFVDADRAGEGVRTLCELKGRIGNGVPVILMSAHLSPSDLFVAFLNGALDVIQKPCGPSEVRERTDSVLKRLRAAEREAIDRVSEASLDHPSVQTAADFHLVGQSTAIRLVFRDLAKVVSDLRETGEGSRGECDAPAAQSSVFITGETGTGKELVARLIHQYGGRSQGRFVPVNCSSLSPDLADSQLFGHVPGAFTGATKEREGLWELADGGTLFLDEVTETPPSVLVKLLRVLQDGQVRRLGSNRLRQTSVRVIAASNRDMQGEIDAGRFRADIYYRLSLHKLHMPPLRERRGDIPVTIEHLARRHFSRRVRFAEDALEVLMSYSFPGNVRELENIVRGAARQSPDGVVYAVDLAAYVEVVNARGDKHRAQLDQLMEMRKDRGAPLTDNVEVKSLEEQLQRHKIKIVRRTLARHNNNVSKAARALKISRQNLYNILRSGEPDTASRITPTRNVTTARESKEQALAAGAN